jgi:hypothetical protein
MIFFIGLEAVRSALTWTQYKVLRVLRGESMESA